MLQKLPALASLAPRFALLVPVLDRPPRYRLYLQGQQIVREGEGEKGRRGEREKGRKGEGETTAYTNNTGSLSPFLPFSPTLLALRTELQNGLEENPYYRHAVALGQLASVEVVMLDSSGESAWLIYERRCLELGQKCGDVKPTALDRWTGWPERFQKLVSDYSE